MTKRSSFESNLSKIQFFFVHEREQSQLYSDISTNAKYC
jgi:hypothetical protein